jgi:hypothetical protein
MDVKAEQYERQVLRIEKERDALEKKLEVCGVFHTACLRTALFIDLDFAGVDRKV